MSNIIETLVVKIASDITEFQQGISNALKGSAEFEQAVNKIGNLGEGISKIGGKIADVGATLTQKLTVPLIGLGTAAIKSYADLEQLMGGVETLFKDSYDTVIANSETAFKRAGMTQNQYLDNVMAFSSRLLQGLGGDTEEAARIADMAMTDMSDNANKFGSNIQSVQNAYQGFAKANYTMLDNLKLGYGGTKEEMQRLLSDAEKLTGIKYNIENFDDIINAIHVIQDDLNITGTTALEATTTISGSFAMAKNSVLDFLANLGNADADMELLKENMISAVKELVKNVKAVIATIWDNIPLEGWQKNLLAAAAAAGPILMVVGKIISGVGGMVTMFSKISSLAPLLSKLGPALGALTGPIGIVIAAVAALVAIFVGLYNTNEEFRTKVQAIWESIKQFFGTVFEAIKQLVENVFNGIKEFWNTWGEDIMAVLSAVWEGIGVAFNLALDGLILAATTIFNAIKEFWDIWGADILAALAMVWNTLTEVFSTVIGTIVTVATEIFNAIKEFWNTWGADILAALAMVWNTLTEVFSTVIGRIITVATEIFNAVKEFWDTWGKDITDAFMGLFNALVDFFTTIFQGIWDIAKSIFENIKNFWDEWGGVILDIFKGAFDLVWGLVETVFNNLKKFWDDWGSSISAVFVAIWKLICNAFETALNVLKNVFNIFVGIFTGDWDKVWNGIKGVFSSIWEGIKTTFKTILDTLLTIAKNIFDNIKTAVTEKFNAVKDAISGILDGIKNFFTELPGKALEWGKNLIFGFIDGIKAVATKVTDTVKGVIDNVANFLGFHSPAKKGEGRFIVEWGYNMIDGFLDGVNKAVPLLNRTMDRVIPDINSAIDEINVSADGRIRASGVSAAAFSGSEAAENKTEITISTEGLFKGAVLTVRDDSDIEKIVRLVLERLADFIAQRNRNAGLQGVN